MTKKKKKKEVAHHCRRPTHHNKGGSWGGYLRPVSGNVGQGILGKQDKLRWDKAQIENNANTIYPFLIFFILYYF